MGRGFINIYLRLINFWCYRCGVLRIASLRRTASRGLYAHAHSSNALIARVGDIKVTLLIEANSGRTVELSALRGAAIATEPGCSGPSNEADSVEFQIQTSNPVAA